jgi:pimeloyl-ACP methyl ester carboxylesterase
MATRAEADSEEGRQGRNAAIELAGRGGAAAIAESMMPRLFAPDAADRTPELLSSVREQIAATTELGIVQALEAMRDRPDSRPLLPTLGGLPTLVVSGAADRLMPAEGMKAMAAAIPGAVYQSIEGAGHLPPVDRPAETTVAIADFLGRMPR